jgi:hypothetical protein
MVALRPRTTPHLPRPIRLISSVHHWRHAPVVSYVVGLLLILVSLLIGSGLGLVGSALLVVEGLPALTEELANLAEGDARVFLTDVLTLLVGEEHVGGETALGCVGVCSRFISIRGADTDE